MCVDFHAKLSGVTHMRQEFTVCQIKSHFSIVCRFSLFSLGIFQALIFTWRNLSGCGQHNQDKPGGTHQGAASTTRINSFLHLSVCQSVSLSVCE
jgi:hypothetical protein